MRTLCSKLIFSLIHRDMQNRLLTCCSGEATGHFGILRLLTAFRAGVTPPCSPGIVLMYQYVNVDLRIDTSSTTSSQAVCAFGLNNIYFHAFRPQFLQFYIKALVLSFDRMFAFYN